MCPWAARVTTWGGWCRGTRAHAIFLLWSRCLHAPLLHQLPLNRVERRDKRALRAGGRDKGTLVTPPELLVGLGARASACGKGRARPRLADRGGRGGEPRARAAGGEGQSARSSLCGEVGGTGAESGPRNKMRNLKARAAAPVPWEGGGVPSPAWFVDSCPPVHGAFSLCASLSPNFPFLQGHDYVVIVPNLNDLISTW